jgi:hypothetical protein
MADNRDRLIRLQLDLSPDQPGLLEGLDAWLRLGLLTEAQVLAFSREQLKCNLPPASIALPIAEADEFANPFAADKDNSPEPTPGSDFLPADEDSPRRHSLPRPRLSAAQAGSQAQVPPRPPSATSLWLGRLVSELSVIWLLGLGVFLVVLSSAVLAATQWARFNAVGQYLVLLAYTLVFWAVGVGCSRRTDLQLTAKTLQMVTLLLVPLNFWAMDGLGVWRAPMGILVGAIATLLLTLATWQVLRQQQSDGLEQGNALALAYLHTGWGIGWMPVMAVYGGVLGSAFVRLYRQRRRSTSPQPQSWPTLAVIISLGLLLLRALTVIEPEQWGQLGLAFGLYGATWVWLGQRRLDLSTPSLPTAVDHTPDATLPTYRWSIALGRGLLLWGWLIAIADWLAQALGVSLLGLGLRLQALRKFGRRRDLLIAYGIAVQLAFVSWALLPQALRQNILAPLNSWANLSGDSTALLGISLFPYVVAMVGLGDWYVRHERSKLGQFCDGVALGSNLILTLISTASGPVLVVNLIASTITAFVGTKRRSPLAQSRILVSYGLVVTSVLVTIGQRWPQLPLARWMMVMFALAVMGLLLSRVLLGLWAKSAWLYGVGLSALAYLLLWGHLLDISFRSGLSWLGLVIPIVLTLIGRHPASVPTTGLALVLTLGLPWTRLLGLGTATGLSGINSIYQRRQAIPVLTLGYALGFVVSGLADWVPGYPRYWADWCVVTTGLTLALWIAWQRLSAISRESSALTSAPLPVTEPRPAETPQLATPSLAALYRTASDAWGHLLCLGLLVVMTGAAGWLYLGWRSPQVMNLVALAGLLLALVLRYEGRVHPLTVYLAGWGLELLLAEALGWRWGSLVVLALGTLGLGAIALALATVLRRDRPTWTTPLHQLTLIYAGLALLLRLSTANAWTGWLVIGASLLALEIGRQGRQPLIRWLALAGLSVGWYELVIYQMLQAPGGAATDGFIVLAGVAVLIMGVYRLGAERLAQRLPQRELLWAAHIHWAFGSLLMLLAGVSLRWGEASLAGVGVAIATALTLYALLQGRLGTSPDFQSAWVYAGLTELVGWFALLRLTMPGLERLDSWWGVVACMVAMPVYWLPWSSRGWPQQPWRVMAVVVPLVITILTRGVEHIPTLWVLTGFYGWLAWHSRRLRVSYLSVSCAVWAIWLWLEAHNIQDNLAFMLPLGLAMLYVAQVDPALQSSEAKTARHWLRVAASALVLLTALSSERWTGIPVGVMGLGAIAAGLLLRTRAFLYTGTLIFALNALNQLILLNSAYPFIKWVVGIVVGIGLIWIAADFERRRTQWLQLTQTWLQDLESWQ